MKHFPASEINSNHDEFASIHRTARTQVAMMSLAAGEESGPLTTVHPHSDHFMYIISGHGTAHVGPTTLKINSGDALLIEAGEPHQIVGGPLRTINVYGPLARD